MIKRKDINHNILQKKNESEKIIRQYAQADTEALLGTLATSPAGLSDAQAAERRQKYGLNIITTGKQNTMMRRLMSALINSFNIILLVIAVITFFTDIVFTSKPSYMTVLIILFMIVLSSTVAFVQGERSNSAAQKLKDMISNKADVIRNNQPIEISMQEIVPGDIVQLSAGDMIPADLRFLSTKDTFVAQAALTGESNPVEKFIDNQDQYSPALTDMTNIGFMGSNIISGSATGVVLTTGNETYIGSMAKSISGNRAKNSFERGVDSVSALLFHRMIVMVPIVFLINGITKHNWGSALLFAISVAVGLTPEMLPLVMTSTLAKGAVFMSRQKVIVKTLGAIQTFGEMDVLCTDKTGTLTEDKIILEKYMNVLGVDETRILRHAYLNSYFQTSLKDLMDLAIINRAKSNGLESILPEFKRVDEIPFDFSRRRMSVVLAEESGKRQLITKGAVEEVISISAYVELNGQVLPLTEEHKRQAMDTYNKHSRDGLRMIAVAQKNDVPDTDVFGVSDEKDMVLIGFIGFLDPPKESAKESIASLKDYGVRTVVLTGDSMGVAVKVCGKVGIDISHSLSGSDVEKMDSQELRNAVKTCSVFAKLSPSQKERVVRALQQNGHTVGYMGDGINDAPPLHQADVGISVDSAVDIAKETADIILLEKDLMVLIRGVLEGRRTFGNIIKYIKMATSGNFGNMISVLLASIFLPFLPMLPVQILTQNLLCDFSQLGIPFDSVDPEYMQEPRKWETKTIKAFMTIMGPLSSVFDIACFSVMWWIIGANTAKQAPLFQCGWFVLGTMSQVLIIHMIRTAKIPFKQSHAAKPLILSTALVAIVAIVIGFTKLSVGFNMSPLPLWYVPWLILMLIAYGLSSQLLKKFFIHLYKQWI